ncbi:MAG TPA: hypothetical protein VHE55_01565 [Fimbriimonadaceae bacterium]|nr:hypothetical protein [Fimbriimonadaceae bacterium]
MEAKRWILSVLAIAAFVGSGSVARAQDSNSAQAKARKAMVGKMAPELAVNQWINTNGKTLSLKSLRGKVVVLDFFTFW